MGRSIKEIFGLRNELIWAILRITDGYSPNHDIQRISAQDVGASEGIIALYQAGIGIYKIPELLSAGMLGTRERRRMIPAKNAIVIVDKIVASHLLSEIISQGETFREKPVFPGQIGGSYFVGRYAVAEHLHKRRRQGKALLFREIKDRRSIALGAWQVLESLRHAFRKQPECHESLKQALSNISNILTMPSKLWQKTVGYYRIQVTKRH